MGRHVSVDLLRRVHQHRDRRPSRLLLFWSSESSQPENLPLFTLNPSLVVSGYWTSADSRRLSNSIEILATGKEVPGCSSRANRSRCRSITPACSSPGRAITTFKFELRLYTPRDTTVRSTMPAGIEPPAAGHFEHGLVGHLQQRRRPSSAPPGAITSRCSTTRPSTSVGWART